MRLLGEKTEFRNSFLVFGGLFIIIVILIWLYWSGCLVNEKWPAIISGLLTGFIVAFVQLFLSWREFQKMDKFDKLRIKEILHRRNKRDYYGNMILNAEEKIWVQGVTAQRFIHHFANMEDSEEGSKALLAALGKGVEVRILVASPDCLKCDADKNKALMVKQRLKEMSEKFKGFKYAYYDHEPTHSIVTIDDESIIGPIFPGVSSEHTPAIHLQNNSKFAEEYLKYFRNQWKQWSQDKEVLQD